jgi:hypothetical protein
MNMAEFQPLSGVAYEIHQELESPANPTTGSIFYWLESNVGKLNNKISTFYSYDSGDYSPQLGHDEKDILKAIYYGFYYKNKARTSLISTSNNNLLSLKDDQSSVSFVNNKDVARAYNDLAKDSDREAKDLANLWKHNRSGPRDTKQSWSGHWQ